MALTLKQIRENISLHEAVSPHNVGDRVHVGTQAVTGELGTVTKTNKFGHSHVTTDSGKEYRFKATGEDVDGSMNKVHSMAHHTSAKEKFERAQAEHAAKKDASAKIRQAHAEANDSAHKDIINKLREHSGDEHLKNLGAPAHQFDRHDGYNGSHTESHVEPGHFGDLFHKITKNVRIRNADDDTQKEHGITHFGTVEYGYQHPGGGSNGHHAYDFTRHTDGSIKIQKPVHAGTSQWGGDNWERKHVKTIE